MNRITEDRKKCFTKIISLFISFYNAAEQDYKDIMSN